MPQTRIEALTEITEQLHTLMFKAEAFCEEGVEPLFSIAQAHKQARRQLQIARLEAEKNPSYGEKYLTALNTSGRAS